VDLLQEPGQVRSQLSDVLALVRVHKREA
jgi:hypothetical protein